MKDFIDRYGKDEGPSIYYATITKMAKGEEVDLEELPKGPYLRKDPKLPNLKIQVKRRRGKIIKKEAATKNIAMPQPIVPIRVVAIGAPANIPAEAAAVPRPKIKLLCFASTTLPSATITTGKEHAPVPIPTINPVKMNIVSSSNTPRSAKPNAAKTAPKAKT